MGLRPVHPTEGRWGRMLTPRRTRFMAGLLATLAVLILLDGAWAWQLHRLNAQIAEPPAEAPGLGAAPELQFAYAHTLAARGDVDAALKRYQSLAGDTPLGLAARFNSANLLMREAVRLQEGAVAGQPGQAGQAVALIELAKEHYREVLRRDSGHWDARYNLERAQRLRPDPDEGDMLPDEDPKRAERAATTMRGYTPGLP
ncbi:MxaK protein [Ideonella sp. DXS29W]|uniref:MxaK protein n=1 Tax=Ideonella lacteola TaxID=2984193 RepID=A0ABU9BII1_9BURK